MLYAFALTLDTLEEFYRRAEYYEAITEKERTTILIQMMHEGLIIGTPIEGTVEEAKEELRKNFNVLDTTEGFGDGQ